MRKGGDELLANKQAWLFFSCFFLRFFRCVPTKKATKEGLPWKPVVVKCFYQNSPPFCQQTWTLSERFSKTYLCRSATICTYGRSKWGVAGVISFSILYNIPRFFEVSWEETEEGLLQPQMTSLRQDAYYISIYITWMYLVFMYVLPFGGLSVLNLLIFLDVR